MSQSEQIKYLTALAQIDAKIRVLDEEFAKSQGELSTLEASIGQLTERANSDRARLASLEKSRRELLDEVRSLENQKAASRAKMGRARVEREVFAVEQELKELERLKQDKEEEIGRLVTEKAALELEIERTDGECSGLTAELGAKGEGLKASLGELQVTLDGLRAERDIAQKRVPVVLFRKYDAIRVKRGFALASTTDGTCRACNMQLPPQLFHRLRREPILEQCPSCNRFIHFADEATVSE